MESIFLLKEKITREMLDAIFHKSIKYDCKWLVTTTVSRFTVNMIDNRVLLAKETINKEDDAQVICVLTTAEDILLMLGVLQRLGAIHDLVKNEETGEVFERKFNIEERLSEYFVNREEQA